MADAEPYCIVVLMSQERASSLEHGFSHPTGVADRRPISEQVQKNISSIAPRCLKQGIINKDAFSYLMSWSRGEGSRLQRPLSYVHLQNRCAVPFRPQLEIPSWTPPSRIKHVDLSFGGENEDSDDDDVEHVEVGLGAIQAV